MVSPPAAAEIISRSVSGLPSSALLVTVHVVWLSARPRGQKGQAEHRHGKDDEATQ